MEFESETKNLNAIEVFTRERLMDDVRQYSCLYDKFCKDYLDKNVKNNAWAAVAAKYGLTPIDAEKKYKTIRSSFTRFLKRKRNAIPGTRAAEIPTPVAFQNLDWLASHIDHKETRWVNGLGKGSDSYLAEYPTLADNDDVYRGSYGELIREDNHTNGEVPLSQTSVDHLIDSPTSSEIHQSPPATLALQTSNPTLSNNTPERSLTMYFEKPKQTADHHIMNGGELQSETTYVFKPNMHNVGASTSLQSLQLQPPPLATTSNTTKRKRPSNDVIENVDMVRDEDDLFCMSLAASLKRLDPRSKAIAKMKFQQVLLEVEFPSTSNANDVA